MTSICPQILMSSYDTLHEGASQCTSFLHVKKRKKKKKRKKRKNKKKKIYIYICKKVDRKPERAVHAKGEPKEGRV